MALIDKETIRAEIERRKKELPEQNAHTTVGAHSIRMAVIYDDLLAFLDTLPEQPVLPGIDEEGIPGRDFIPVDWVDACDRYGKWKIVRAEQPAEGLEEAAMAQYPKVWKEYPKDRIIRSEEYYDLNEDRRDAFIVGAEWQKAQDQKTIELAEDHAMLAGMNKMEQQMMEKAYDTIMQFDELDDLVPTFENMQKFGFKEGDKVKVIILKEK